MQDRESIRVDLYLIECYSNHMTSDVNPRSRRYDNRNRQEMAGQTRRRILEAARRLFAEKGYGATTIQAIADEAGVAVQTVFAAFGSKLEILKQLFDISVVGDDAALPLAERPEWRAWEAEGDGERMVALFSRANRDIAERTADVVGVLAAAASSHPEIARMWEQAEAARYQDQSRLAERLADRGLLRPTLSVRQAADVIWTLAGPGIYTDLARRRGWSSQEYDEWLADHLGHALLRRSR